MHFTESDTTVKPEVTTLKLRILPAHTAADYRAPNQPAKCLQFPFTSI